MRQGTKRIALVKIMALLLVFCWTTTRASASDWLDGMLHFDPRDWELTTEFDGSKRGTDDAVTTDSNFQEGLRVHQNGYVLDPAIATFAIDQSYTLEQGKNTPSDGEATSRNASFTNYNINVSLLHGTVLPVTVSGFASRDSGTVNGGLGSRTEFINQSVDLGVYYKSPYFPTSIRYSELTRDQTFSSGLSSRTSETDNTLRTISILGKSTKLQVGLDYDQFTDQASDENRDFSEASANVNHIFRWGKGSQLSSRSVFQSRTGFNPSRRFNLDENVNLKHSSKLDSAFTYRYSTLSQTTDTISHFGSTELTHKLYNNLVTKINLSGSTETIDRSQKDVYLGKVDMNYNKGILWKGKLTSAAGVGYGWTDNLSSGDLFAITDESHAVAVGGTVQLRQRFISASSIVVSNLAGTTFYTQGLDYNFISVKDDRTELQILGGGAIAVGQTILIDYQYQPAPTTSYAHIPFNFRVGLDFSRISFFEELSGTKFSVTSGEDDSLNDQFTSKSGVKLTYKQSDLEATTAAEFEHSVDGDLKTNTFSLSEAVAYTFRPEATLNADATQTYVISGGRLTEVYSFNLSGNWTPLRGLFIRPFLNARMNKSEPYSELSSGKINDTFIGTGFSLRWRVRSIDVRLRYNHDNRFGTTATTQEDRLRLALSRKF